MRRRRSKEHSDPVGQANRGGVIFLNVPLTPKRALMPDELAWGEEATGRKDSSAVMQLVWLALKELPVENRSKPIHVISTDTLVEQPVVAAWVDASHARMRQAAAEQQMPIPLSFPKLRRIGHQFQAGRHACCIAGS